MKKRLSIALALVVAALALAVSLPGAPDDKLSGKWHVTLDTEGGPREATAVFKLDGDKVTGKWNDTDDIAGTFADPKLDLSFNLTNTEVGAGAFKATTELAGDTIKGTWKFLEYSGGFKATREK